jgi:predicted alpha/beta-hydrolase family hydrolase
MIISQGENVNGTIIFAHGAGMAMDHNYMQQFSLLLCQRGFKVIRFEFLYMQHRRETGKQKFPDKLDVLVERFKEVIDSCRSDLVESNKPLYLLGKSLGGRVATLIANELDPLLRLKGVFVLGYPFHPIGKPSILRTAHLKNQQVEVSIFQGERDKFGSMNEVFEYQHMLDVTLYWLEDGDHDLKPRVKSGFTQLQHLSKIADIIQKKAVKNLF